MSAQSVQAQALENSNRMKLFTKLRSLSLRDSRLLLSIATSLLSKFIGVGSTLITIPLTLHYLGKEQFAVWMVVSGIVGFLSFSDLGMGMGLQNALSRAYGLEDKESPKYLIAVGYGLVILLVCLIALVLGVSIFFLDPSVLFEGNSISKDQMSHALYAGLFTFLFSIPVGLIQRVLGGIQKTYVANMLALIGSVLSLMSILVVIFFDLGLTFLIVFFIASTTVVQLGYSIFFFSKYKEYRWNYSGGIKAYAPRILSTGGWTVLVQAIYSVKMNVPVLIVSSVVGSTAVAEYSIVQKLTGLIFTVMSVALQPMWVVYGEAYARGDNKWMADRLKQSLKFTLLLTMFGAVTLSLAGQYIIDIWTQGEVKPDEKLILLFSIWSVLSCLNVCYAMLLNGTNHFKSQGIFQVFLVLIALICAGLLAGKMDSEGVILSMLIFSELAMLPLYRYISRSIIK